MSGGRDDNDNGTGLSDVVGPPGRVVGNMRDFTIDWVKRRSIVVQFGIAALVGEFVEYGLGSIAPLVPTSSGLLPGVTATQIQVAILGVLITQTVVQRKKLNEIQAVETGMDLPVATDGGRRTTGSSQNATDQGGTSGGAALGGAIAGGALGASYGPQGAVAGAILGAILGDNLEADDDANDERV